MMIEKQLISNYIVEVNNSFNEIIKFVKDSNLKSRLSYVQDILLSNNIHERGFSDQKFIIRLKTVMEKALKGTNNIQYFENEIKTFLDKIDFEDTDSFLNAYSIDQKSIKKNSIKEKLGGKSKIIKTIKREIKQFKIWIPKAVDILSKIESEEFLSSYSHLERTKSIIYEFYDFEEFIYILDLINLKIHKVFNISELQTLKKLLQHFRSMRIVNFPNHLYQIIFKCKQELLSWIKQSQHSSFYDKYNKWLAEKSLERTFDSQLEKTIDCC